MEYKKKRAKPALKLELPNTIIKTAEIFIPDKNQNTDVNMKNFTNDLKLSKNQIQNIYTATKEQSDSQIWFDQRKGRITASKFHQVYTRVNTLKVSQYQTPDNLLRNLIERKIFETVATKHGISMEVHAKEAVKKILCKSHSNFIFSNPGMTIHEKYPFVSASPDLEGVCKCCGKCVIEIKCPYSICESKPTTNNLIYLKEVTTDHGTVVRLNKNHQYYTQIQGQLATTETKHAWFFIYTHNGYHLEKIDFDHTFWNKVENNLVEFWYKYLAPALISKTFTVTEEQEVITSTSSKLTIPTTPVQEISTVDFIKETPALGSSKNDLITLDISIPNVKLNKRIRKCESNISTNTSIAYDKPPAKKKKQKMKREKHRHYPNYISVMCAGTTVKTL